MTQPADTEGETEVGGIEEAHKDTLDVIKERGVFIAGLDDFFAPMGFRDE